MIEAKYRTGSNSLRRRNNELSELTNFETTEDEE